MGPIAPAPDSRKLTKVRHSAFYSTALGYLLGQNRRLTRYHPLVVYGVAEGLIGVFALLFPFLVRFIDTVYVAAGGSFLLRRGHDGAAGTNSRS